MKEITRQQMRDIDNYAINKLKIPSIVLMENAALKVIKNIDLENNQSFTVVCGIGNNGGDGLAVARHLITLNKNVSIFILGNVKDASDDFIANLKIIEALEANVKLIKSSNDLSLLETSLNKSDIAIDALFGTGLKRDVEGIYLLAVKMVNNNADSIISIDIPSGIDADSGEVKNIAVKANKTITFHLPKKGLKNAEEYCKDLIVEKIGIPDFVLDKVS